MKSRRQRAHPQGTSAHNRIVHRPAIGVAREAAPELSRQARQRLAMVDWHRAHGANVSRTARRYGVSRPTVYRWLARFDPRRLETLEDRSPAPRRRRAPTWGEGQIAAVRRLRETFPRWGKDKLAVLLEAEGLYLPVSRVGRILAWLKRTRQLVEPVRRARARRRRAPRPYAVRKPWGFQAIAPGDLVQLDTLDVRPVPGVVLKQFTARDVVSRWDVLELASQATARAAVRMLDALAARMPFAVRAISVDGGSEFMAGFELACAERGIALFVLPPKSPKLNGCAERADRTHTEEFHECSLAAPTVAALGAELRVWESIYNEVRPHQALGYLTPRQFLDEWRRRHPLAA